MPHRDQEIALLRREVEMLMSERQALLHVAGAAAALIASLDSRRLPVAAIESADLVATSINALTEETLQDAAVALVLRRPLGGCARGRRFQEQIGADRLQPRLVGEAHDPELANVLQAHLALLLDQHFAALVDHHVDRIGGNGEAWTDGIAIVGNDLTIGIELKRTVARVRPGTVRQIDGKQALALDGKIERVVGRGQVALAGNAIDGSQPGAQADLHAGGNDGARFGRGRSDPAQVIVEEVLKLGPAPLERGRVHVGEVVRDHLDVLLLGEHSRRGDVERSHRMNVLSCRGDRL